MQVHKKPEAGVARVQEKFASAVEQAAKDFALAVNVLAGLRASGKTGTVVKTAGKNVDVTRAAIFTVLKERFDGLMNDQELDKLKRAEVKVAKAHSKAESLAFAPGVVVEPDHVTHGGHQQAEEMKAKAATSGETYGRVINGKPLVVGPTTDLKAAVKAWENAPELPKTPEHSVGGRLTTERERALTARMEHELKEPGDKALWAQMTKTFPGTYVNQYDKGGYYVSLPEAHEGGNLVSRVGDGATLQEAFDAAKKAMTNPKATWVLDAFNPEKRKELRWAPAWNEWAPAHTSRKAEPKDLMGADAANWQATVRAFPGAHVLQRTDGSFYVTGLPEKHDLGVFRGISGNGSTAEAAVRASLETLTKKHERLTLDLAGKHEVTFKDGAFLPYEDTLRAEVAAAVTKAGDARVALEVLSDVVFQDVKLRLIAGLDASAPHREEALTKAVGDMLLETIRQSGDFASSTRYFDDLLKDVNEQAKKGGLALALAEKPASRSLLAYQAQLQGAA